MYEFLTNYEKNTGFKHKELENLPEIPLCFEYVFNWFLQLSERRQNSGFSFQPISYSEIKAFFDLRQETPQQWEIDLILAFDCIFLQEQRAE